MDFYNAVPFPDFVRKKLIFPGSILELIRVEDELAGKMLADKGYQVFWVREGLITLSEEDGPMSDHCLTNAKADIIAIWECLGAT